MTFPAFDVALARGQERERAFAAIFRSDDDLVTVECKSQVNSRTHVFIEMEGYGKPSGLALSTAAYWAIEVRADVWVLMRHEEVIALADAAIARFGRSHGGDRGLSVGASVPKDWLVRKP